MQSAWGHVSNQGLAPLLVQGNALFLQLLCIAYYQQ